MCDKLSKKQQSYVDRVIDVCNETKYRTISPGLCGSCPQCQSDFGMELEQSDFRYMEWIERDRIHIELRDIATEEYTLIEFWDDDAREFLEQNQSTGESIEQALRKEADYYDMLDNVPDDVKEAIFNHKISEETYLDEGGFSWQGCDVCGNQLGQDLYAAHAFDSEDSLIHYDICRNCLCYLANGDIPDDDCI